MTAPAKSGQRYFRNKQLADYLGITPQGLDKWMRNEALGCPKPIEINGTKYNDMWQWEPWLMARAVDRVSAAASGRPSRLERLKGKRS